MSLYIINPKVTHPAVGRCVDDLHRRGPILLGPYQLNPLVDSIQSLYLGPTWRLATSGRDTLLNGKRFENAMWRLWGQKFLNRKKIRGNSEFKTRTTMLNGRPWREKELLTPIVTSPNTFRSRHEITIIKPDVEVDSPLSAKAVQPLSKSASIEGVDSGNFALLRSCMKRGSTSTCGSDSPLSFRTNLSSPMTPTKRRVLFNACVERSVIDLAPNSCNEGSNSSDSSLGLCFSDWATEVYALSSILGACRSLSYDPSLEGNYPRHGDDSSDEEEGLLVPTALLDTDEAVLLRLHPTQIKPLAGGLMPDPHVVFVPPQGSDIEEGELHPHEGTPLRRRYRLTTLEDEVLEEEFEALSKSSVDPPNSSTNPNRVAFGDDWFTDEQFWDIHTRAPTDNGEESDDETSELRSRWSPDEGGRVDEPEEVGGDFYYDCEEGYSSDENYDGDDDYEVEEAVDGAELVGMMANSIGSLFW